MIHPNIAPGQKYSIPHRFYSQDNSSQREIFSAAEDRSKPVSRRTGAFEPVCCQKSSETKLSADSGQSASRWAGAALIRQKAGTKFVYPGNVCYLLYTFFPEPDHPMESVGEYLRKQRELRNLPLAVISKSTKIQCRYLEAIEGDRYDRLPPRFYTRSYITLYAKCLGIDPEEVIHRYQEIQTPPGAVPLEAKKPLHVLRRGIKPWVLSLPVLGMIILVLLSTSFTSYTVRERHRPTVSLQPVGSSPLSQEGLKGFSPHESTEIEAGRSVPRQIIGNEMTKSGPELPGNAIPEEEPGLQILTAKVGKGIDAEEGGPRLIGESSEFASDSQRVYFYTRVRTQKEGKIAHVWSLDGKEIQRIEIEVRPPTWSTYSYVTLRPHPGGIWKVEAREGDNVLSGQTFKVIKSDSLT
jgi:hypothetical protein